MKKVLLLSALTIFLTDLAFAQFFCPVPHGTIHRAFVEYENDTYITITSGYGECNGEYWENLSDTVYEVTSLASGEDYHYIYIDDSESVYPTVSFTDTTTEPVWTDAKQGWYNGDDRCIGVVWSPSTGSVISEFISDDQGRYVYGYDLKIKLLISDAHPDGTWKSLEATAYSPVNANGLYLWAMAVDTGSNVTLSVASAEHGGSRLALGGYGYVSGTDWIMLKRGASRDLKWVGQNGDEDEVGIILYGYSIER